MNSPRAPLEAHSGSVELQDALELGETNRRRKSFLPIRDYRDHDKRTQPVVPHHGWTYVEALNWDILGAEDGIQRRRNSTSRLHFIVFLSRSLLSIPPQTLCRSKSTHLVVLRFGKVASFLVGFFLHVHVAAFLCNHLSYPSRTRISRRLQPIYYNQGPIFPSTPATWATRMH